MIYKIMITKDSKNNGQKIFENHVIERFEK